MTPEEIKFFWHVTGGLGLGALLTLGVTFFLLRFYLPSYLSEKGKNLATKEDIGQITKIVEDVKHQNNELLEERKAHNQLRFAAIDRRLVAHQEAFTQWSELSRLATIGHQMPPDDLDAVVLGVRQWWYSNAIYLEPEVRLRFDQVLITANRLPSMLKMWHQGDATESALNALRTAQDTVRELGSAILQAVELPALTGKEPARYAFMDVELPAMTMTASGA